jgi:hypothetical protein
VLLACAGCTLDFTLPNAPFERFPVFDAPPPSPRALLSFSEDDLGTPAVIASRLPDERPEKVALGDFDDDGDLDVVFVGSLGLPPNGAPVVLRSTLVEEGVLRLADATDGAFAEVPPGGGCATAPTVLLFAPPLLVGPGIFQCGSVYRRTDPLRFVRAEPDVFPGADAMLHSGVAAATAHDLDSIDVLVGASMRASLFVGDSSGWTQRTAFPEPLAIESASFADFDGDGLTDLVAAPTLTGTTGEPHLLRGVPGGFESTRTTAMLETAGLGGGRFAAGDFDGDARTDLAILGRSSGTEAPFRVLFNEGGLVFRAVDPLVTPFAIDNLDYSFFTAHDFDNDGDLDAVLVTWDSLDVFRNDGATFEVVSFPATVFDPHDAAAGDVDLDGDVDLFVCAGNGSDVFCKLERNETNGTDFIEIYLAGPPGNPSALGARVVLFPEGRAGDFDARPLIERHVAVSASQPSVPMVHAGLPQGPAAFDVWIRWPSIATPTIVRSVPRGARIRVRSP